MANSVIHFEIVSPEGLIFEDDVDEVMLPTDKGQIAILPHHIPLYSKLTEGEVVVKKGAREQVIAIVGGFLEIKKNSVTLLSDYAIKAESIEIAKAMEAKKRAEQAIKEQEGKADFTLAERDLRKSILELKVAEKIRKRQHP